LVQVVWTKRAIADVEAIRTYIGLFSPLAAQRYALRLFNAANGLDENPLRGRAIPKGRRQLSTIPPYLICYRIKGEVVEIITIRHGARTPD